MKGSIQDIVLLLVIVFAGSISILVSSYLLTQLEPVMNTSAATGLINPVGNHTVVMAKTAVETFNYGFLFITFGLGMVTIISAFMVRSHPIFFFFMIIMLCVEIIITGQFSNAWHMIAYDTELASETSKFGIIDALMDNMSLIFLAIGFIIAILTLSKSPDSGGNI